MCCTDPHAHHRFTFHIQTQATGDVSITATVAQAAYQGLRDDDDRPLAPADVARYLLDLMDYTLNSIDALLDGVSEHELYAGYQFPFPITTPYTETMEESHAKP